MRGLCIGFLLAIVLCLFGCDTESGGDYELHWVSNRVVTRHSDIYTVYLDSSAGIIAFETNSRGAYFVKTRRNLWVSWTRQAREDESAWDIYDAGRIEFKCVDKQYDHNR